MVRLVQLVRHLPLVPCFQVIQVCLQVLEVLIDPEVQNCLVNQHLLLVPYFQPVPIVPVVRQDQVPLEHHCFQECLLVPRLLLSLVHLSIQLVLLDPVSLADQLVPFHRLVQEHQQYLDCQVILVPQVGLCLLTDLLDLYLQVIHLAQQAQRVLKVLKRQLHPLAQKSLVVLCYLWFQLRQLYQEPQWLQCHLYCPVDLEAH